MHFPFIFPIICQFSKSSQRSEPSFFFAFPLRETPLALSHSKKQKNKYSAIIHDDGLLSVLYNQMLEGTPFGPYPRISMDHLNKTIEIRMLPWTSLNSETNPRKTFDISNTNFPWKNIKKWSLTSKCSRSSHGIVQNSRNSKYSSLKNREYVLPNYNFSEYFEHKCLSKIECKCASAWNRHESLTSSSNPHGWDSGSDSSDSPELTPF